MLLFTLYPFKDTRSINNQTAWIDYDLTGYQNFIENPKSTGCVFMTPTGQWDRMPCDEKNNLFCSLELLSWQVLIIFSIICKLYR